MSFDLFFLTAPGPDRTWADAVDALEAAAEAELPFDAATEAVWEQVRTAARRVLPHAVEHFAARSRELTDEATAIQLSVHPGEIALNVPYWHTGPDADRVVAVLRDVVAAVEAATGLTAYDPQADAPFLGDGEHHATASFDRAAEVLREVVGSSPPPPEKRGWRRFLSR